MRAYMNSQLRGKFLLSGICKHYISEEIQKVRFSKTVEESERHTNFLDRQIQNMTTINVNSKNRRRCSKEPMKHGQTVRSPGLCVATPDGSCPLTGGSSEGSESERSSAEIGLWNPKVGDRLAVWSHEVVFNERHKTPTQLEPLRRVGDPLADGCVAALGSKTGADAFMILEQYLSRPICEQEAEAPRQFQDSVLKVPDWVDWTIIKQGQQLYWKYANPIDFVLFHASLVGGFGAPRIARTLQCTNYLSSSPDRSYQRLMETCLMVYDCMNGGIQSLQPRTGKGWTSIVRVRLLHTQVRLRILSVAESHPDYYSVEEDGVPINQEDLVCTLCAFSIAVILALETIGIHLSPKEVFAYLHLWRLVGHYMGILPENNPLTSCEDARASFESVVRHLFTHPDNTSANLANGLLLAVAGKPPVRQSFAFHSASVRALLGEDLSNALQIDSSGLYNRIMIKLLFAFFRLPPTPWWTQVVQAWHTWFLKDTATRIDLNFSMKVVPQHV